MALVVLSVVWTAPAFAQTAAEADPPSPEMTVLGRRPEVAQTTITATEVRMLPGAFGDPFRAVDVLPSATPIVSGLPYFYLRGAPPNNNAFYVDGVRVPLLYHVGLGAGVIHAGLIESVEIFPSAPPASYGNVTGAVISGETLEPASDFHGAANVRLVDVGTLLETPLGSDRGSALVAGHYGYPGPILGAITPDVELDYWDYQARVTLPISERGTLGLFAFGSHDYVATGSPQIEQFVSDFHRIDLRYDQDLGDGHARVAFTFGYDYRGASPSYLTDKSAAARVDLVQKLGPALRLRAGAVARVDVYGFEHRTPMSVHEPDVPSTADPPPTNLSAGAYVDFVWRVVPGVELVPGARVDVFSSTRAVASGDAHKTKVTIPAVDPRLALRISLAPAVDSITSAGLSHQYPSLRIGNVPGSVSTGEGFPVGVKQLQTSAQASQGFEFNLPADFAVTTTGFYSAFWGMTDLTATCFEVMQPTYPPNTTGEPRPPDPWYCPDNEPVHGQAYGLELVVRGVLVQGLTGWISYALSRSTREAHFPTLDGGDAVAIVAGEFDRTHVLNAALALELGAGWYAGSRFVFYTGAPYSALAGSIPVPPYHDRRGPPFFRLDVRLEKRWTLSDSAFISLVLEGQNVTLSREVSSLGRDCMGVLGPEGGNTKCKVAKVGPITIPSVGVEAVF